MVRFAEAFPQPEIVSALSRQLAWSHFKEIIYLKDDLKRDFYADMCRVERWSVRTLRQKIDGMLYERTALSRKPEKLIRQELQSLRAEDTVTPDFVFQDPYLLDFLGLKDTYSEKDLEAALLREIKRFLLELGAGFAFVGRTAPHTTSTGIAPPRHSAPRDAAMVDTGCLMRRPPHEGQKPRPLHENATTISSSQHSHRTWTHPCSRTPQRR